MPGNQKLKLRQVAAIAEALEELSDVMLEIRPTTNRPDSQLYGYWENAISGFTANMVSLAHLEQHLFQKLDAKGLTSLADQPHDSLKFATAVAPLQDPPGNPPG